MNRHLKAILAAVVVFACAPGVLQAASISVNVAGEMVEVPTYYIPDTSGQGGTFGIGSPTNQQWTHANAEGRITLMGELDPDPSLAFAASVTDFGTPSTFGFIFVLPLAPTVPDPATVFDSLSGSVTNGAADGGVTVTAVPPLGIPVDGDMTDEIQVYTLSDDGGATWKNVGLDAGPTTTIPLMGFESGPYGTFNQGPIAAIFTAGAWTHMRADINFMLSGGGDAFSFNGAKVLTPIPEPSTAILTLIAAALGCCFWRRS
jgi:hypothetical protein